MVWLQCKYVTNIPINTRRPREVGETDTEHKSQNHRLLRKHTQPGRSVTTEQEYFLGVTSGRYQVSPTYTHPTQSEFTRTASPQYISTPTTPWM